MYSDFETAEQQPLLEVSVHENKGPHVENKKVSRYTEHQMSLYDITESFGTKINQADPINSYGLDMITVQKQQNKFGLNKLNPPPTIPLWLLFIHQFGNLFMVYKLFFI